MALSAQSEAAEDFIADDDADKIHWRRGKMGLIIASPSTLLLQFTAIGEDNLTSGSPESMSCFPEHPGFMLFMYSYAE